MFWFTVYFFCACSRHRLLEGQGNNERENSYIWLPLDKVTEWMTVNKWKLCVNCSWRNLNGGDGRSYEHHLSSSEIKAWKKFHDFFDTSAVLYQPS